MEVIAPNLTYSSQFEYLKKKANSQMITLKELTQGR